MRTADRSPARPRADAGVDLLELLGAPVPVEQPERALPSRLAHAPAPDRVGEQLPDRRRQGVESPRGTMRPVTPCSTTSGRPPASLATTAVSQPMASAAGIPKPSSNDGITDSAAAR